MDAIEFVKEYGFEYSKAALKQATNNANYVEWYPLRSRFYITDFGCNRAVFLVDLKQIVNAFDIVKYFGGIGNAKYNLSNTSLLSSELTNLKTAIELVEKCNES